MKVKIISVAEVTNNPMFADMCTEYANESGNADIGFSQPNTRFYKTMESLGRCFCVGVFDGEDMVGFAALLLNEHPHYSTNIGVCDAIFIKREFRKGPVGLRLIRKVRELAKEKGAPGVYFSAPANSRLSILFARLFNETDRMYWAKSKE